MVLEMMDRWQVTDKSLTIFQRFLLQDSSGWTCAQGEWESAACLLPPLTCFPSSLHLNFTIIKKIDQTRNQVSNFSKPFLYTLFCFFFPPCSFQVHMDKISSFPITLGALLFFSSLLCPWKRNLHSTHGVVLVSFAGTVGNRNEKQKAENKVQRALRVCFLSV